MSVDNNNNYARRKQLNEVTMMILGNLLWAMLTFIYPSYYANNLLVNEPGVPLNEACITFPRNGSKFIINEFNGGDVI